MIYLPVTKANWHLPAIRSVTAISKAEILELQAVSTVALGPVNRNWFIKWPVIIGAVVPIKTISKWLANIKWKAALV